MIPIVVAVLALLGTLVGVILAHRRWKTDRRGPYQAERVTAYKELWSVAEGLAVELRLERIEPTEVEARIRALNVMMLKAGPFLDSSDRERATEYVRLATRFAELVRAGENAELLVQMEKTAELPEQLFRGAEAVGVVYHQAMEVRSSLEWRVRRVLRDE